MTTAKNQVLLLYQTREYEQFDISIQSTSLDQLNELRAYFSMFGIATQPPVEVYDVGQSD